MRPCSRAFKSICNEFRGYLMMKRDFLVADLFCGAGGSSTGAERAILALGRKMTLVCINHWPVAIETHKLNHPTARHYIEDVSVAKPDELVPEGYLDLLMASPECTHFSRARGGKPVNDQSRMNPWSIMRWLTTLDVRCLLVENVPEFRSWGPIDRDGNPIPEMRGIYFDAWIAAIKKLGYRLKWELLNAADYGDATTRVRFFLIARKDGKRIRFPTPSHSETGDGSIRHEKWRAAREIIDWQNAGRSLLDDPHYQKKPLSEKTRRRIAKGLLRFGGSLAPLYNNLLGIEDAVVSGDGNVEPFVMGRQGHSPAYRSVDEPIPTQVTSGGSLLINPSLVKYFGTATAVPIDKPIPTLTTKARYGLVNPQIEPFVLGQHSCSAPRSTDKPIMTITTDGKDDDRSRDINKPLGTGTTKRGTGLVEPMIVQTDQTGSNGACVRPVNSPLATIVTKQNVALVEPVIEAVESGKVDPRRLVIIDEQPYSLDIRFRMLTNQELARAMGFTDNESTYEFVGNIGEVTKQIGNAVPVNMAKALVKTILS